MIKKLLILLVIVYMTSISSFAAGPTVSFLTEQIQSVDKTNAMVLRLGYFLGLDDAGSGLEPFIGTEFRPRWDEDGDIEPPSIVTFGILNRFEDILDPNSVIPLLPDFFLSIINEDVEVSPYAGLQFSINFIDKDSGLMGGIAGLRIKTTPNSNSALIFEVRYDDTFGDLKMIPDNRFNGYIGFVFPF